MAGERPVAVGSFQAGNRFLEWRYDADWHRADDSEWQIGLVGFVGNLETLARANRLNASSSPPTLLSHLLARCGEPLLDQLFGNYALIALDRRRGRLLAARDRLGGRTLSYAHTSGGWCVAEQAADVLERMGFDFRPNEQAMACHFAGQPAPPPGQTAFAGVFEMLPGEVLVIDADGSHSRRRLPDICFDAAPITDTTEAVERFRSLFDSAVAARLSESGPVACMLSGGMDSAPVAESANRQLSQSDRRLLPISWSLPQFSQADETRWITGLSRHLGLEARIFENSGLPFDQLETEQIDPSWPMFNAFRPLIDHCYQLATQSGCRVILNGNAGDDLYAPLQQLYRGYWLDGDYGLIARDLLHILRRRGIRGLLSHPPLRHLLSRLWMRQAEKGAEWLTPLGKCYWRPDSALYESFEDHRVPEHAWQLLGPRMTFGRAQESFFTRRRGVERRDPYHDEAVVAFMLNAPFRFSVQEGRTKWIMREACIGRLPEPVRRKRRTGLMGSYYQAGLEANRQRLTDFLFRECTGWQEWVRPAAIRALVEERSGPKPPASLLPRCVGHALWQSYWSGRS